MVILKATVRPGRTRSMITYLTGRWEDRVSIVLWNSAGDKGCGHTRLRRVKQPQTSERANVRAVERLGRRRVRHLAGVFYSLVACPRRRRIQTLWTHCILCQPKRVLPRPWRFPFPTLWPEKSPQYSPKCLFSPETSQNRIHPFKGTTEAMQSLLQRISETMLNFHIRAKPWSTIGIASIDSPHRWMAAHCAAGLRAVSSPPSIWKEWCLFTPCHPLL